MVGEQSVDRTSAPYDVARAALCEGRVVAPFHEKALQEWTRLELDPRTGKVDHPPGGSKDQPGTRERCRRCRIGSSGSRFR